jgi:hypothetical protein
MAGSAVRKESSKEMTATETTAIRNVDGAETSTKDFASSPSKPRLGLPPGFVPRFQRIGQVVLLYENIYCLPDGREFVPVTPTGTLARDRHLYALLTVQQFARDGRGSVFVRLDGRVFDYSVVQTNADLEMFDTGYTIHDLKRTGRYASPVSDRRKKAAIGLSDRRK